MPHRCLSAGVKACATATLLLFGCPIFAQTPDRARTEALARRAGARLQALQREADRLASAEQTLLGELRKLEVEREIKAEELRQADREEEKVQAEIAAATTRIEQLQQEDLSARPDLRARLIETYKLGQGRYLRLLLSTADLRRMGQAARAVAVMAKLDRDRIAAHQRVLASLEASRTSLEARRKSAEKLRAEAARAQAAADRAAQARNDLIRDIDQRRDLNAQLSGELQMAQQKLQLALKGLGSAAPVDVASLPLRPFRGDLEWPTAGVVRRRFSRAAAAGAPASNGIEVSADEGTRVQAVHGGVVAFADTFAGFGNLVILDHGAGTFTLYGNLLDLAVAKGARVELHDTLGHVGLSPAGTAGLYFEMRVDGEPVDPLQWLKKK